MTVPPTKKAVGEGVEVPSLTDTICDPVKPAGTVKVTVASPLPSVLDIEPFARVAVVPPTVTVKGWLAANPVTNTVAADPAGPDAGEGALMSRYGLVSQLMKTLVCWTSYWAA